jgi:hypothetical protein
MFQVKYRKITLRKHTLILTLATSTRCTETRTRDQCKERKQGLHLKQMDFIAILHRDVPFIIPFRTFFD